MLIPGFQLLYSFLYTCFLIGLWQVLFWLIITFWGCVRTDFMSVLSIVLSTTQSPLPIMDIPLSCWLAPTGLLSLTWGRKAGGYWFYSVSEKRWVWGYNIYKLAVSKFLYKMLGYVYSPGGISSKSVETQLCLWYEAELPHVNTVHLSFFPVVIRLTCNSVIGGESERVREWEREREALLCLRAEECMLLLWIYDFMFSSW